MTDCCRRPDCRLCGSANLSQILRLRPSALANAFVPIAERNKPQRLYPLEVFLCGQCGHAQLLDVVDPAALFSNYLYVSATSKVFVKHFEDYAKSLIDSYKIDRSAAIVDIGSNDGTLLSFFRRAGYSVVGVEPAKNVAELANSAGIPTIPQFFSSPIALKIRRQYGSAAVVIANNVFAHIDDLHEVVEGIKILLLQDGIFVFEVSYLVDVYEKLLFDTIYHEHLSYHSITPLVPFFKGHRMEVIDVQRVESHGGSIRTIAQRIDGPYTIRASVDRALEHERTMGITTTQAFSDYADKIDRLRLELTELLTSIKRQGKTIGGYGAPAKATTLMHHFGISDRILDYIIDDSPLKQGLFSPGYHVPIVASSVLDEAPPDYLLILAWNFATSIMGKCELYHKRGGRFVIPLPRLEVL